MSKLRAPLLSLVSSTPESRIEPSHVLASNVGLLKVFVSGWSINVGSLRVTVSGWSTGGGPTIQIVAALSANAVGARCDVRARR